MDIVAVGIGAAVGAIIRYQIGLLAIRNNVHTYWTTLCINVVGSFIIGCVLAKQDMNKYIVLFLSSGFAGGFTTFSTYSLDVAKLMQANDFGTAAILVFASNILGILFAFAGYRLFRAV